MLLSVGTIGVVAKVIQSFVSAHTSVALFAGKRLVIVILAAFVCPHSPIAMNRKIENILVNVLHMAIPLPFRNDNISCFVSSFRLLST